MERVWVFNMARVQYLMDILEELKVNAQQVEEKEVEELAACILKAERIFVGEPTTPAVGKGDLLVIGSGSGETESLVVMAQKARRLGAAVATVTIHPEASIGRLSECCIRLPGATPKSELADTCKTVQIMGNAFEQMTWIVYDVVIMYLMKKMGLSEEEMFSRHANLE